MRTKTILLILFFSIFPAHKSSAIDESTGLILSGASIATTSGLCETASLKKERSALNKEIITLFIKLLENEKTRELLLLEIDKLTTESTSNETEIISQQENSLNLFYEKSKKILEKSVHDIIDPFKEKKSQ